MVFNNFLLTFVSNQIKIMKQLIIIIGISLSLMSCTENQRVKSFGGTGTIEIKKGDQLEMVTWKKEQIWILTSKRPDSVQPKSYEFYEKSSFGVMEGTYIIKEK